MTEKKQYNNLLGSRYVFFSSLKNGLDDGTQEEMWQYGKNLTMYNNAKKHFSNLTSQSSAYDLYEDSGYYTFIQSMITQLQNIAAIERSNEIAYLEKTRQKLNEQLLDKNISPQMKNDIENILSLFPTGESSTWNYTEIITLFNKTRKNSLKLQENLQKVYEQILDNKDKLDLDQLKEVDNKELDRKILASLKELYLIQYKTYKEEATKTIKPLEDTITQQLSTNITNALHQAAINPNIIDKINKKIDKGINSKYFENAIKSALVEQAKTNLDMSANELEAWLENEINKISLNSVNHFEQMFTNGKAEASSLEELALIEGEGLANYFLQAVGTNKKKIEAALQILGNTSKETEKTVKQLIHNIKQADKSTSSRAGSGYKSQLTKILKNIIKQKFEVYEKDFFNTLEHKVSKTEKRQYIQEIVTKYSLQTISNNIILNNLKVTQTSGPDIAEILSADVIREALEKSVNSHSTVYGHTTQAKVDATFTAFFTEPKDLKLRTKAVTNFINNLDNFIENFTKTYFVKAKGKTDISQAEQLYKEMITNLKADYDNAIASLKNDQEKIDRLNKFLEDTFLGGISVKEYRFYNDKLGFHGGSLGGNHNAIEAIKTINKMYSVGGISTIDTNVLIEAIMNCAPGTVLWDENYGIIDRIKNYLLGGAILAMFDEGFSSTKSILDMVTSLFPTGGLKTVHLYMFDTLYIPQSYMLENICNNLIKLDQNIQSEVRINTFNTSNSIEIINHINNVDIPLDNSAEERWNTVSKKAQEHAEIHVLLLAGLLDIFENLPSLITKVN